jgi:sulfide dehydrogenase cytochrome subunit
MRLWMISSLGSLRRHATAGSLAVLALTVALPLQAADTTARDLAASCAACHGTDGHATGRMVVLAGQDRAVLVEKMLGFKTGGKTATVMHQHAKGYSEAEIGLIADYFSTRTRAAQ